MRNLIHQLNMLGKPIQALLIYRANRNEPGYYIESAKAAHNGELINHHPLSIREAIALATAMQFEGKSLDFLTPQNIMAENILSIRPGLRGYAVWYTPAQSVHLIFAHQLKIDNGTAWVPPLLWRADAENLTLFALDSDERPTVSNTLYAAPFYNIDEEGRVCMGNVTVNAAQASSLENFIQRWQQYFWGSYFTHSIREVGHDSYLAPLYRKLIGTDQPFPRQALKPTPLTLQKLLA